jgi:hypothetical protein
VDVKGRALQTPGGLGRSYVVSAYVNPHKKIEKQNPNVGNRKVKDGSIFVAGLLNLPWIFEGRTHWIN